MSKKNRRIKRSVPDGIGNPCPKCSKPMERMKHGPTWKLKKDQPYYFRYWDRCRPCHHIQHYETAKVMLSSKTGAPAQGDNLTAEYREIIGR